MAIDPRWRFVLWPFGVTPGRAFVRLDGDRLFARYGFWSLTTRIDNVEHWTITGPYRWWTAIGLRSSWPLREWAFDTNARPASTCGSGGRCASGWSFEPTS